MTSSESEDENIKRFLEAADTTLINDAMFQKDPDQTDSTQGPAPKPVDSLKSNRYLVEDENVFQSDINVTESMKKFVGKKLSTIIEQKISFVDFSDKSIRETDNSSPSFGVRLLRDSESYLKATDIEENSVELSRKKRFKPIKKRTVEPDSRDVKEKLSLAVIEPNAIPESTEYWTNRPKATLYQYKTNGSLNIIQEVPSEFTHLKRKNHWDASKIATFRKKTKTR